MSIVSEKLLKVASDIDALIEQLSKEEVTDEIDQTKTASMKSNATSTFGTVSDFSDTQSNAEQAFVSRILS